MSYTKQKGKLLEDHCSQRMIELGLDPKAERDGASGASNKDKRDIRTTCDINGRTLGIECKNWSKSSVKIWWDQTKKLQTLGYEPVLVYKLFGEPLGESKVVIYLDTFLELISQQKGEIVKSLYDNPKLKWKVKRVKDAVQELFKELN